VLVCDNCAYADRVHIFVQIVRVAAHARVQPYSKSFVKHKNCCSLTEWSVVRTPLTVSMPTLKHSSATVLSQPVCAQCSRISHPRANFTSHIASQHTPEHSCGAVQWVAVGQTVKFHRLSPYLPTAACCGGTPPAPTH